MKKIVVETTVKEINDDVENIIDRTQSVANIEYDICIQNIVINKSSDSGSFSFNLTSYPKIRGAKGIRIISDCRLNLQHTHMAESYDLGFFVKDITLFLGEDTGEHREGETQVYNDGDTIGYYGNITLTNKDDKVANVKIIWYY